MTENEKQEAFDRWYDENYDEWAEGEEGIALREELEQAFKSGIAELEKENEQLTISYETLKLHDEEEIGMLKSENAELKKKKEEIEIMTNFCKACNKMHTDQLTKAKEHIENLLYYVKQCTCERSNYEEIEKDIKEAEQFLKENK